MPSLCMSPAVRYVTQTSVYASMFTGPLTDRKIAAYRKRGFYGHSGILALAKTKAKRTSAKRSRSLTVMAKYLTE